MPFIEIKDTKLHYIKTGDHGKSVLLLHGWGQNTSMMEPIANHLAPHFQVYNIDFPGFGESAEPKVSWSVYDYMDCIREFIDEMGIENPILIGHSFGVRVAILYASQYPVYKMVFTGGAGIRDKRGMDYYIKVYSYKAMKQVFKLPGLKQYKSTLQNKMGSSDYRNTSGVMRETFVKIVNEDLTEYLPKIKSEVFLVWGDLDDATPLWMGQLMEEKIPNAGLAIFKGEGHYAYWNQMPRFLACLDAFFVKDKE